MRDTAHDLALELFVSAKAGVDETISAYGRAVPTDGFWIGGKFPSLVYKSVADIDRGELAWWIGNNSRSAWYGVWMDQSDGRIYFDGATHMIFEKNARNLGVQRGEIAIWDIAKGEEIRLNEVNNS